MASPVKKVQGSQKWLLFRLGEEKGHPHEKKIAFYYLMS
jgi:hypothetical protein